LNVNRFAQRGDSVALPVAQALHPGNGPRWTSLDDETTRRHRLAQQKPTGFPVGSALLWTAMDFAGQSKLLGCQVAEKHPQSVFKTGAIDHSATSPGASHRSQWRRFHNQAKPQRAQRGRASLGRKQRRTTKYAKHTKTNGPPVPQPFLLKLPGSGSGTCRTRPRSG
jgi:hypothetical protein